MMLLARLAHAVRIKGQQVRKAPPKLRRRAAYHVFYPIGMPFFRLAHAALRLNRRAAQQAPRRRPRNLLRTMLALAARHQRAKAAQAKQRLVAHRIAIHPREFVAATIFAYTLYLKRKIKPRAIVAPKVRRRMGYRVFYPIGAPFYRLAHAALRLRRARIIPPRIRRSRMLHAALLLRVLHAIRISRRPASRVVIRRGAHHVFYPIGAPFYRLAHAALRLRHRAIQAAPRRRPHLEMRLLLARAAHSLRIPRRPGRPLALRLRRGRHLWMLLSSLARGHRLAMRKQAAIVKRRRFERIKGTVLGTWFAHGRQQQKPVWRRLLSLFRRPLRRRAGILEYPLPSPSAPRLYFTATLDPTTAVGVALDQTSQSLATLDATIVAGATML
jgi:hypothetical protein